jgi:FeS assembly SUF system protein
MNPMKSSKPSRSKPNDTAEVPQEAARDAGNIEQAVIEALRTVYDPEIPVNIYELGLVYEIDVDAQGRVLVRMTLTSPGCPVAGLLIPEIERKVLAVEGVTDVFVELVWEPPWDPSRMTEAARLQLGLL